MKQCCKCKKEINEEKEICDECKEKELSKWKKRNKELTIIQIVLAIFIILIVVFIYREINCSNNNCLETSEIDTQEIQAFNLAWSNYEGVQTGVHVKSMINILIGHANTYQDEPEKVIEVEFVDENGIGEKIQYSNREQLADFINRLNNLYYKIEPKLNYVVEFDFGGEPIIRTIKIRSGGEV